MQRQISNFQLDWEQNTQDSPFARPMADNPAIQYQSGFPGEDVAVADGSFDRGSPLSGFGATVQTKQNMDQLDPLATVGADIRPAMSPMTELLYDIMDLSNGQAPGTSRTKVLAADQIKQNLGKQDQQFRLKQAEGLAWKATEEQDPERKKAYGAAIKRMMPEFAGLDDLTAATFLTDKAVRESELKLRQELIKQQAMTDRELMKQAAMTEREFGKQGMTTEREVMKQGMMGEREQALEGARAGNAMQRVERQGEQAMGRTVYAQDAANARAATTAAAANERAQLAAQTARRGQDIGAQRALDVANINAASRAASDESRERTQMIKGTQAAFGLGGKTAGAQAADQKMSAKQQEQISGQQRLVDIYEPGKYARLADEIMQNQHLFGARARNLETFGAGPVLRQTFTNKDLEKKGRIQQEITEAIENQIQMLSQSGFRATMMNATNQQKMILGGLSGTNNLTAAEIAGNLRRFDERLRPDIAAAKRNLEVYNSGRNPFAPGAQGSAAQPAAGNRSEWGGL